MYVARWDKGEGEKSKFFDSEEEFQNWYAEHGDQFVYCHGTLHGFAVYELNEVDVLEIA